jgi:hypothetical protein
MVLYYPLANMWQRSDYWIMVLKMIAFCDIAPCGLVELDWRFRGAFCVHHQGDDCPDGEGSMYFWNVSLLLWDYTGLYPRRLSSSYYPLWEPEVSNNGTVSCELTPVTSLLLICGGQKMIAPPVCLHQDYIWVRQNVVSYCNMIKYLLFQVYLQRHCEETIYRKCIWCTIYWWYCDVSNWKIKSIKMFACEIIMIKHCN